MKKTWNREAWIKAVKQQAAAWEKAKKEMDAYLKKVPGATSIQACNMADRVTKAMIAVAKARRKMQRAACGLN